MTKQKKTLFPEKVVDGYKVKPWSLGTVEELAPCLERLTLTFINKGITLDNAEEEAPKIIFSVLPEVSTVLAATLKKEVLEIKELPLDTIVALLLTVVTQNIAYLKNSFSPIKNLIKEMTQIV